MNTIEIQNNIIRQILNITDIDLLTKIEKSLYKPLTVAYDSKGQPLTAEQYKNEIDLAINEMETGKDKGKTTDEVLKSISNAYNLE